MAENIAVDENMEGAPLTLTQAKHAISASKTNKKLLALYM